MSDGAIQARVLELLSKQMDGDSKATLETRIPGDTTMDSVKVMDFLLELEDEFDITIPLNRLAEVETAADLVEAIEKIN